MKIFSIVFLVSISFVASLQAQNFWQPTNGPVGRTVYSLAVYPNGYLFAGTIDSGVYRSTDNGNSWKKVSPTAPVFSLMINSTGKIFAATGDIMASSDTGNTWTGSSLPSGSATGSIAFNSNGTLFAGSYGSIGGVFYSNDNGKNWIKTNMPNRPINSVFVNSNDYIFAGASSSNPTQTGIYRSTDNGDTWTHPIDTATFNYYTAFTSNKAGIIFTGPNGWPAGYHSGFMRSTDSGKSFMKVSLKDTSIGAIAINKSGTLFVMVGVSDGFVVFRSSDNGDNWIRTNTGLTGIDTRCFAVNNSTGYIYAGTSNGVYRSVNSTTSVKKGANNVSSILSLQQNYPNPVTAMTRINFSLTKEDHSSMLFEVRDILGRVVYDTQVELSQKEITFDASMLTNGVYLYSLRNGNVVVSKRMLVNK